eukprot:9791627-Lingulodinium_polyedra.AAC.1
MGCKSDNRSTYATRSCGGGAGRPGGAAMTADGAPAVSSQLLLLARRAANATPTTRRPSTAEPWA